MGFQIQSTATSFFCTFRALSVSKGPKGVPFRRSSDMTRGEQSHVQNTDKNYTTFSLSLLSQKRKMGNYGEYHSQVHSIYNFAYVLMPS